MSKTVATPCAAYLDMQPYWTLCKDIREGTERLREKRADYLPKFEAETAQEWDARVKMTFVNDAYAQALSDLVGLVFAQAPKLMAADLEIERYAENIDGEGSHWEVFAQSALDAALHYGHAVIFTDYPQVAKEATVAEAKAQQQRPYATLYTAEQVYDAVYEIIGGVRVLTYVVFCEGYMSTMGEVLKQYRVLQQEITRDASGLATGLGAISFELWRESTKTDATLMSVGSGTLRGPNRIPARIIYGGEKRAPMHTRPALLGLAYLNIEEAQVTSDYAVVMHKCNVPTPIFRGRITEGKKGAPIRLGAGIDVSTDGGAEMLEPTGAALGATRQRLADLAHRMAQKGAHVPEPQGSITATQAALYARQRNARLLRATRSLQDALEGMFADFVAFHAGAPNEGMVEVEFNTDFAGVFDNTFAKLALDAYSAGVLPMWAVLEVFKSGKLPDTFDAEQIALEQLSDREADLMRQQKQLTDQMVGAVTSAMPKPADGLDFVLDAEGKTTGMRVNRAGATAP